MIQTDSEKQPLAALKNKEFRSFIIGRFLFIMGLRMTYTVIGWWVYELTQNPLALGMVGLSEVVAALSFALYAGHYIDRNENKSLLLKCVILYFCSVLLFFFISDNDNTKSLNTWTITAIILAVIFLTGVIRAFSGPTFSAMISKIVPKKMLTSAASISSATWMTGSIFGHAAGGFCIAIFGIHYTFLVVLGFVFLGYIFLNKLTTKPVYINVAQNTWQSVKEGINYVFKTKEILGALSLDLFAVLFGGAAAMIPVFAKDILKVGPTGFGWLNASTDIGSIIMVIALTLFPLRRNQGKLLLYAIFGFGMCIIVFAISKLYWLSFIAMMLSGCLDGVSVIVRNTILQLKTPDELRGRVMSVNSMFINSSNELGMFESGIAAKLMGTVTSVVFGGCMTIGVVIFTWFKAPDLRKMEY